jgi:hypothetical protein
MTENPYQAPRVDQPDLWPLVPRGDGPWRDDRQLVVCLSQPRMPARCIKTGATDAQAVSFKAKAPSGRKVVLDVPVSAVWRSEQHRRLRLGLGMVVSGMVLLILSTLVAVVQYSTDPSANGLLVVIVAGPLLSLGGLFYLAVRHQAILTVRKVVGGYAWLSGAHAEFLERLPEWDGFAPRDLFAPNRP